MTFLRLTVLDGEIRYVLHVAGEPFLNWPLKQRGLAMAAYLEAIA